MMTQYKEITLEKYNILKQECRCNKCSHFFEEYISQDYELVCFEDETGIKYFLPTYGEYGYLDLLEKMIDEWNPRERITKMVTERFVEKLNELTQSKVSLLQKVKCPICHSYDIFVCKRVTIENHPIQWLKIDTNKIGSH